MSLASPAERKQPRYSFPLFCGGVIATGISLFWDWKWPSRNKGVLGSSRELLLQLRSAPHRRVMISREGAMVVTVPRDHIAPLSSVVASELDRSGQVSEAFRDAFRRLQDVSETLERLTPLPLNHPDYTVLIPLEDLAWLLAPPKGGFFLHTEPIKAKALPVLSDSHKLRLISIPVWLALEIVRCAREGYGLFGDIVEHSGPASAWVEMRRVLGVQAKKMLEVANALPAFRKSLRTRRIDFSDLFQREALAHLTSPLEAVFNHVWSRNGEILFRPGPTAVDFIHALEQVTKPSFVGNNWPGSQERWSNALEYGKNTLVIDLTKVAERVSFDPLGRPELSSIADRLIAATSESFASWVLLHAGFRTDFVLAAVMERLSIPLPQAEVDAIDPRWANEVTPETQARLMDYLRHSVPSDDHFVRMVALDIRSVIHEFFLGHVWLDWGNISAGDLGVHFSQFVEQLSGAALTLSQQTYLNNLWEEPTSSTWAHYFVLDQIEKMLIEHFRATVRTPEQRAKLRLTLLHANSVLASVKGELRFWLVRSPEALESLEATASYNRVSTIARLSKFEAMGVREFASQITRRCGLSWPPGLRAPFDLTEYLETNSGISIVSRPNDFVSIYFDRLFGPLRQPLPRTFFHPRFSKAVKEEFLALLIDFSAEPFARLP